MGATVLGVSPDDIESHKRFKEKFDINFELLSDPEHRVAEAYGAWVKKESYGKDHWGINRSTILLNPAGFIAHTWAKVKPEEHPAEVIEKLRELTSSSN